MQCGKTKERWGKRIGKNRFFLTGIQELSCLGSGKNFKKKVSILSVNVKAQDSEISPQLTAETAQPDEKCADIDLKIEEPPLHEPEVFCHENTELVFHRCEPNALQVSAGRPVACGRLAHGCDGEALHSPPTFFLV